MNVPTTPASLFAVVPSCATTWPRARQVTSRRSPTAQLLQTLLTQGIDDWSTIDLATLQALYDDTWAYPSDEEVWEVEDPHGVSWDQALANPWHVVCSDPALPPYAHLPVVAVSTHPFY